MTTKVYAENTFNLADDLHGGGTVTVQHDDFIVSKVDNALEVFDGPWTFKIDGFLESAFNGMAFYDDGITKALPNSKITVGTEGVIVNTGGTGNGFSGITSTQGLDEIGR